MARFPAPSSSAPRLCPTCGTRVGSAATKCLVCGADLTLSGASSSQQGRTRGRRIFPHPIIIVLISLLALAGVGLVLAASGTVEVPDIFQRDTPTATATATPPPTFTATATPSETPAPTATPLPPIEYKVVAGDTCLAIAARHNVSVQSIVALNNLDPNCTLSIGAVLQIPQPTPTVTPLPTATLNASIATQVPRATYVVFSGDTCNGIATFYHITVADLMEVNGLTDCTLIREGQVLLIPLERAVTPGPTPTPTLPPPWPAPNQLLPNDGQAFATAEATVTLQWTSVGALRAGEFYYVTVEDVTCACAQFYTQATTETRLILPVELRPADGTVHIFRWTVGTVRLKPGATETQPDYDPAGATSSARVFAWSGLGAAPAP